MYLLLRHIHISAVILSGSLFILRGGWMLWAPRMLDRRWVRVVPHLIDTVLLASAIALTVTIGQYPLVNGWLTAKVGALLIYIVLGSIALKQGRRRSVRIAALIGALLTFGYIVAVARAHSPLPWHVW